MAATFNSNLATPLDRSRQFLGDTDTNDALFPDDTYLAILGPSVNPARAAAQLAQDLSARFARKVTTDVDDQGKKYSDLQKHYTDLSNRLTAIANEIDRERALAGAGDLSAAMGGGILVGGTSASEILKARCDPDNPDNVPWIGSYGR